MRFDNVLAAAHAMAAALEKAHTTVGKPEAVWVTVCEDIDMVTQERCPRANGVVMVGIKNAKRAFLANEIVVPLKIFDGIGDQRREVTIERKLRRRTESSDWRDYEPAGDWKQVHTDARVSIAGGE